jgi:hypothetical protein
VGALWLACPAPPLIESLERFGLKSRGFGGCALDCLLVSAIGCLHIGNTGRIAVRNIGALYSSSVLLFAADASIGNWQDFDCGAGSGGAI